MKKTFTRIATTLLLVIIALCTGYWVNAFLQPIHPQVKTLELAAVVTGKRYIVYVKLSPELCGKTVYATIQDGHTTHEEEHEILPGIEASTGRYIGVVVLEIPAHMNTRHEPSIQITVTYNGCEITSDSIPIRDHVIRFDEENKDRPAKYEAGKLAALKRGWLFL